MSEMFADRSGLLFTAVALTGTLNCCAPPPVTGIILKLPAYGGLKITYIVLWKEEP